MSGKSYVIADGPKDKMRSKNCFYVIEWGHDVYVWHERHKMMYTALTHISCIFGSVNPAYVINC